MKPSLFILLLLAGAGMSLRAQPLFTYGKNSVSKEEFLRAYNKNNTGNSQTEKAYRDYLDLYIRFKLKVAAGYEAKLDTLPAQASELQNFRNQIAEGFMNDDQSLQFLMDEAFRHSLKDLRLSNAGRSGVTRPPAADSRQRILSINASSLPRRAEAPSVRRRSRPFVPLPAARTRPSLARAFRR